jgi:hypothetical protein
VTPTLPAEVVTAMASREHRLHHWLWHEIRNKWLTYPEDVQNQIRDMGWDPPRPAQDERGRPIVDNDAGEDFFYMHRQMLIDVSRILSRVNDPKYPRVLVWSELPAPGDPDFPVPPAWFDPTRGADALDRRIGFETVQRLKSEIFYQKRLLPWQRMFTDPAFLRGITLGRLGTLMEQSIHAAMHMRWASPPAGARPEPSPTEGDTIDERWDDPRYDFLGDTYSSHVHPVFWSLHGWIDDRIEDWKAANGVFGNDFWKGTWLGKMPQHAPPAAPAPPQAAHAPPPTAATPPTAAAPAPPVAPAPPPTGDVTEPAHTEPAAHGPTPTAVTHAMAGNGHAGGADKEEMEQLVSMISRCGIFYEGYARVLNSPFV